MFQKILERMAEGTVDTDYLRKRISCKICFTRESDYYDQIDLKNRAGMWLN
jgi:hypothetical protein